MAKVIVNRPQIFYDFGSQWFEPLVRLVLSKDMDGNGLNYFIRDICILFLKWDNFVPSYGQKPLVTSFMVIKYQFPFF